MEEKIEMQEILYTPLYKIFFLISSLTLIVFTVFFVLIQNRNQELKLAYTSLEKDGQKSFSTLTGYHEILKKNQKKHIYTYLLTDEFGKVHEMTEFVDDKSYLKLRVGNTVITRHKKFILAGQERILARIEGNDQILPNFDYLENICIFGIVFSLSIGLGGFVLLIFKRNLA